MTSTSKKAWWRELGAISQGMLFLDGHIATPQAAKSLQPLESPPVSATDKQAQQRNQQTRQDGYAKRVREMTALSLFR